MTESSTLPSSSWPRIVFHVDLDAFYAAVEQRDDPALRGRPVIVGGTGRRGVVSTASYEARKYGVHSALPMYLAKQRCPQGVFLSGRMGVYSAVSKQVMAILADYSPQVEPLSLDEAFLEMTGTEELMGPPEQSARALVDRVQREVNLVISVGVATQKYIAKVASDLEKPAGLTIVSPGQEVAFLAPLPIERLWGVGPKSAARVRAMGLNTIGEVGAADPAWLERELGHLGMHIHTLAQGRDSRSVKTGVRRKSVGAERTLSANVTGHKAVRALILPLADSVAASLRKKRRVCTGVRLKLKYADFQSVTRQMRLLSATDNANTMMGAIDELLTRADLDTPMRLIGLQAYDLASADDVAQPSLFAEASPATQSPLDTALDAVREKFGNDALRRASVQRHDRFDDHLHGTERGDSD